MGIETPVLFMAGSDDDVSGYEHGTRAIFEGAVNAERYLLTFENAGHDAAAPIPEPRDTRRDGGVARDGVALRETVRLNTIAQHFATAFFDVHLKGDEAKAPYLDLVEDAVAGVWSVDAAGMVQRLLCDRLRLGEAADAQVATECGVDRGSLVAVESFARPGRPFARRPCSRTEGTTLRCSASNRPRSSAVSPTSRSSSSDTKRRQRRGQRLEQLKAEHVAGDGSRHAGRAA